MNLTEIEQQARWFANLGIKVFPIRIQKIGGKWQKVPLSEHGHKDASWNTGDNDWSRANGFGLVMGDGWYTIDVDSQKSSDVENNVRKWAETHNLPTRTRTHSTPSGGWHLIYRLPKGWENLRTRGNVIEGMDTRGAGGWIAFGAGYGVVRDIEPATMSIQACKALDGGGSANGGPVVLKGYNPPENAEELQKKLERAKMFGPALFRARWRGDRTGLVDKSGSAMDHSVAKLLSMQGWTEDEITWALLNAFEYGSARNKGQEHVAVRAAGRSAVKTIENTKEEHEKIVAFKDAEVTPDMEAAMRAVLRGGK